MDEIFDPKVEHFDAYECWDADCEYVDEDFEEVLYCSAPYDFVCPLFRKRVEKDLNI